MRHAFLAALAASSSTFAQTAPAGQAAPSSTHSAAPVRDVIVTAPVVQTERDVLQGASVLTGEALARDLKPTIGETLQHLPGVSATSFGPAASRPILRGLQGERIRVLTDGIGSIDVSNTSVDHAVVIDPLLAERIEVLRGPSALLFGSSAAGGVVNVLDRRIPRAIPEGGYDLNAIANYGYAANERSVGAAGDVAIGRLVLNANGSYLKTGDLRIGGFALSPAARAAAQSQVGLPQEVEEGEDPIDFAAAANLRGRLPNTAAETWTAGGGASIVTDTGHLGVSYGHYDSFYGVPIRYATEVGQEQEAPRLKLVQDRVDLRGEVETGDGFLERIRVRAGHATYRHDEVEPSGEVASTFRNKGTEGRLELVQANRGGWQGALGAQYAHRTFSVEGEEAFLPRSETNQTGLFTLQQYDGGAFKAAGGLRYEWTDAASRVPDGDLRFLSARRSFQALSASLGASVGSDTLRVGLNGSRTERAPAAEELFANGEHPGTQAYELGNPDFRKEKGWGVEATLHAHGDRFSLDASAYYNWYDDFIFENQVEQAVCEAAAAPSGREVGLPCYQFQQAGARYWGFEAEGSATLFRFGTTRINADLLGDYVRATVDDVGPAPRIPPLRLLGGLEAQGERFTARAEVERVFAQGRIAAFETRTPGYTLVNASVSVKPFGDERTLLILSVNNIGDVTARRHSSFLKDFAPLAGRDFRATLRLGL